MKLITWSYLYIHSNAEFLSSEAEIHFNNFTEMIAPETKIVQENVWYHHEFLHQVSFYIRPFKINK